MALPHYAPLWDKMPQNAPLFIVDADSIVVRYPLHNSRRQAFARSHAHCSKFVLVTLNVPIKRLSVNSGPVSQFFSCHCLHASFIFRYSSYDTAPAFRSAISCSSFSLSLARLAAMACCSAVFAVCLVIFSFARSRRRAAASSFLLKLLCAHPSSRCFVSHEVSSSSLIFRRPVTFSAQ